MTKKYATDADVLRFIRALYPEAPELALASFDEKKALNDAAETIERARGALRRYGRHDAACSIASSWACTCGLQQEMTGVAPDEPKVPHDSSRCPATLQKYGQCLRPPNHIGPCEFQ